MCTWWEDAGWEAAMRARHAWGKLLNNALSSTSQATREEFFNYSTSSCPVLTTGFPNNNSCHAMTKYPHFNGETEVCKD